MVDGLVADMSSLLKTFEDSRRPIMFTMFVLFENIVHRTSSSGSRIRDFVDLHQCDSVEFSMSLIFVMNNAVRVYQTTCLQECCQAAKEDLPKFA